MLTRAHPDAPPKQHGSWVATEIVTCTDLKRRIGILDKFIRVAKHLEVQKNYFTMIAIMGGLMSVPVERLKKTWEVSARCCIRDSFPLIPSTRCSLCATVEWRGFFPTKSHSVKQLLSRARMTSPTSRGNLAINDGKGVLEGTRNIRCFWFRILGFVIRLGSKPPALPPCTADTHTGSEQQDCGDV